jgi:uncharacterized membrane protein YbhN (UPF0104 family)
VKIFAFLAQLAITAALFAFLSQKVDFAHVVAAIRNISTPTLIVVLCLFCTQMLLASYRLRYTLGFLGSKTTLLVSARSVLAGSFFGQTPLSNFGGDMVRVWTIFRDGVKLRTAASAVTIDRLFGFLGLVAVILCGLPLLWLHATKPELRFGIIAVLGIVGLGVGIVVALQKMPIGLRSRFRFLDWIGQVSSEFHMIAVAKKSSATMVLMAMLAHFTTLVIFYFIARDVQMSVSFAEVLYLAPFPLLASYLPISVGGWGVREGAMVAAFSLVNVPPASTLSASIIFGIFSLLVALPGGLVWFHAFMTPAKASRESISDLSPAELQLKSGGK